MEEQRDDEEESSKDLQLGLHHVCLVPVRGRLHVRESVRAGDAWRACPLRQRCRTRGSPLRSCSEEDAWPSTVTAAVRIRSSIILLVVETIALSPRFS